MAPEESVFGAKEAETRTRVRHCTHYVAGFCGDGIYRRTKETDALCANLWRMRMAVKHHLTLHIDRTPHGQTFWHIGC